MNFFTSSQCCHRRTDVCGAPGWGWGNPLPRRTERPHHGQSHPLSRRRTPSRRRRASGRPSLQTSKHKSMVTTCWLVMLVWLCCGRYTVWDSSFQNSKAMKADTEFETRAQKTLQLLKYLFLVQQPLTQTVFEALSRQYLTGSLMHALGQTEQWRSFTAEHGDGMEPFSIKNTCRRTAQD